MNISTKTIDIIVVEQVARIASNMLLEAVSNHGSALTEERRKLIHGAVTALAHFRDARMEDENLVIINARAAAPEKR